MEKNRFKLLLMVALLILYSCKDKEYFDNVMPNENILSKDTIEAKKQIDAMTYDAYVATSSFVNSQMSAESIILNNKESISYYSNEIQETLSRGFHVIHLLNKIERTVHTEMKHTPDMSDIYALKAFIYYNMAMLSGNTPLSDIRDWKRSYGMNKVEASEVYSYCQELLNKCDLSHQREDKLFNADAIKLLIVEIALMQKNKEKALEYIHRIPYINKNIFAFKNKNGITPIYTNKNIALLKEEAEGKNNSQAWYNLGISYGIWAALKRQGTAQKYTQSWHDEPKEMVGLTDNNGVIIELGVDRFKKTERNTIKEFTYNYFSNFIKSNNATYTLKNKTSIIKAVYLKEDDSAEDVCEFLYDKNDRISQITMLYGTGQKHIVNIEWGNDDTIVKVESNIDGIKKTNTYTYTNYPTKNFVAFEGTDLRYCIPSIVGIDPYLFMKGYYGKYPHYLVKTAIVNGDTITNTYEYDENENILKVTNTKGYTATFSWK